VQNIHKLSPEEVATVDQDPTTLVISVRDPATGETYSQAVKFSEAQYQTVKNFCYNIAEENLEKFSRTNAGGKRLLALRNAEGLENEKAYILGVLYPLSDMSSALHKWIFAMLDKSHPLYANDGSLDRAKLPSEAWTVCELKGGGEAPILKTSLKYLPTLCDNWFFNKVQKAAPLDRRFMAKDFDMQGESRVGIIIKLVQRAVERYWSLVRPSDKDRKYYFPLAEEAPFVGQKVEMVKPREDASQYYMSREAAQLFFVPNFEDGPQRFGTHQECIGLATRAHLLRSFAAEGGKCSEVDDPK